MGDARPISWEIWNCRYVIVRIQTKRLFTVGYLRHKKVEGEPLRAKVQIGFESKNYPSKNGEPRTSNTYLMLWGDERASGWLVLDFDIDGGIAYRVLKAAQGGEDSAVYDALRIAFLDLQAHAVRDEYDAEGRKLEWMRKSLLPLLACLAFEIPFEERIPLNGTGHE